MKRLQPGAKGTGSLSGERPLSGSELDVLEAVFAPGDEIIFSGKPRGRPPGLFRTKPGSTYVTEERSTCCPPLPCCLAGWPMASL